MGQIDSGIFGRCPKMVRTGKFGGTRPGHAQIFHSIIGIRAIEIIKMNWVHNI